MSDQTVVSPTKGDAGSIPAGEHMLFSLLLFHSATANIAVQQGYIFPFGDNTLPHPDISSQKLESAQIRTRNANKYLGDKVFFFLKGRVDPC